MCIELHYLRRSLHSSVLQIGTHFSAVDSFMRQTLVFILLTCACVCRLSRQNLTSVATTNIQKAGAPLSSGTMCHYREWRQR